MASQVEIVNRALLNLGTRAQIEAIDEGSTEAVFAQGLWDQTLESTLAAFPWPFATAFQALALLTTTPPGIWDYVYRYPANCVRGRYFVNSAGIRNVDTIIPWEVGWDGASGRVVFTDEPSAVLCYTALITDPTVYDVHFNFVLAWALAAALAIPLTENPRLRQEAHTIYQDALRQGRVAMGNERGQDAPATPTLVSARE